MMRIQSILSAILIATFHTAGFRPVVTAAFLASLAVMASAAPLLAAPVPRTVPTVAEVVSVRGDEQVAFVDDPRPRAVDIAQALATGDFLRTGRYGALAILFRDQTQIRVHRNSELAVRGVRVPGGPAQTELRLERGAIWSRARSTPDTLKIDTPSAAAGIRGTDWYLEVDPAGRSTLIVLDGQVELSNPLGSVTVQRGEIAVAEIGKPPTKTILLNPRDRPQWQLVITPDWIRILPVTGLTTGPLRAARERLATLAATAPSAPALLDLAEAEYELAEYDTARSHLAEVGPADGLLRGRVALLRGLLFAQAQRFDEADRAFAEAAAVLDGRRKFIAQLGRLEIVLARRAYTDAERALEALGRAFPDYPEVELARIQLTSFRGEQREAIELADRGQRRFPADSRFPVWLAHLYLLVDEPDRMRAAIEEAIRVDPEQYLAWHLKGTYHHFVAADPREAAAAYRRGIELYPNYAPTWNNLALLLMDLGDYDGARSAILTAIRLAPSDALYLTTYASLLIVTFEDLDEGEELLRRALEIDPSQSGALLLSGTLALKRGQPAEAVRAMLKATVVDPGLAGATTGLGIAHYHARDFTAAEETIRNATRLDPRDPIPPLVGSIMAQDLAQAGEAIRLGREALQRYERYPTFAIESFAKSQTGILNVGAAYANLGLNDWGEYYGQLSFNPYWASSHLFLATQYASLEARRSEAVQGLLLDPLAVSTRNRYFDFFRQPFHDLTVGGSVGAQEQAITHSQFGVLQGFVRLPAPLAYFVNFERSDQGGFRDNSGVIRESGLLALGTRLRERHGVVASLGGSRTDRGVPGSLDVNDRDDELVTSNVNASLGYHYRAAATNQVLARLAASHTTDRFSNDDPVGFTVSSRTGSLFQTFGIEGTRRLYTSGLCDFPPSQADVTLLLGPLCPAFGRPLLGSDVPEVVDTKTTASVDADLTSAQLQFRHMLDVGPVRATYGGEVSPSWLAVRTRTAVFAPTGTANLVLPNATLRPPFFAVFFPFGETVLERESDEFDRLAAVVYADGDVEVAPGLRLEAGLFVRHFDEGDARNTSLDPRAGIAWRMARGHWLRAAGQRVLMLPIQGSLAPVATVGLVARDDLTVPGGSVTEYKIRWDAEWLPRLFTFVTVEQQRLSRFLLPIQLSTDVLSAEKALVGTVAAGANVWLGERWGVFTRHRWSWTENLSKGPNRGRDLPLVPDRTFDAGVTWIHPIQLRLSGFASYVGERRADLANSDRLSSYWTVNALANWQPWRKRWSFTLGLENLLDDQHEVAKGFPSPGLSVSLTAEYRFGK